MSCYHALIGFPIGMTANGKTEYKIAGYWHPKSQELNPDAIKIPCGKCLGCRLDYSRAWADRMMLELDHEPRAMFVTLTYNDDHLPMVYDDADVPIHCNLSKRDLQLFLKRLRKQWPDRKLRYYACGEYGSEYERSHYHIILYGLSLDDFKDDLVYRGRSKLNFPLWSSDTFGKCWSDPKTGESYGYNRLAEVTWKTCAYVARYVQKKVFHGVNSFCEVDDEFQKEFSLMSRRPGIGAYYIVDHEDVFDMSKIFVSGKPEGMQVPKFFMKRLSLTDPEKYDIICAGRKEFANDALLLKLQQTDLEYYDLMELEENKKFQQVSTLRRGS